MFKNMFGKDKETIKTDAYDRPQSPKLTREKKSKDFDVSSIRSPKVSSRKERNTEPSLHKAIFDVHSGSVSEPLQRYIIEDDDFAKGAYGKVSLGRDKLTGEKIVIKKVHTKTPIKMINNEVRAGKTLGENEHIAALREYIDKSDAHYFVFQYVKGEELFTYLEKINFTPQLEKDARFIIKQVLGALEHIHSKNIAHRDIKLENILIDAKSLKTTVIDLGLCAFMDGDNKLCKDWCGSDNYLAPEIVRRTPYNGYLADVFSTGVVLFALLFGVFPFENLRVNSSAMRVPLKPLRVRFPADVKVSDSAKELLLRMLEDDPLKRISVKNIMRHEWILDGQEPPKTPLSSDSGFNL